MTSQISTLPYLNIAAYKFVTLEDLPERRQKLKQLALECQLKGTVLLSPEGINMFLAGKVEQLRRFLAEVCAEDAFAQLDVKESFSDSQPFTRLLIRIKREIISFNMEGIDPRTKSAPRVLAKELKQWLDEGREVIMFDTRNNYEVDVGTFDNAVPANVDHFREFPAAVEKLPEEWKDKTIVTFCTGGIRCEKAAPYMEQKGFNKVFQLEGGILKYFEECGNSHYQGDCFVFDKRVALDPNLAESSLTICYACQATLTEEDQKSPVYIPAVTCPHCFVSEEESRARQIAQHNQLIQDILDPLPGLLPYENTRPISVPQEYEHQNIVDFLAGVARFRTREEWEARLANNRIFYQDRPVDATRSVRAGERYECHEPGTVEPAINTNIQIIYEDDAVVVVNKPAPLPIHPCGRFNRHTLEWILNQVYDPIRVKPAHRIDANTSGIVVFSKSRAVAGRLQPGFEQGHFKKTYLARIQGQLPQTEMICDAPIASVPTVAGARIVSEDGQSAVTELRQMQTFADGTSLVECKPITGRTNQIRVHLWHLKCPIVGDPLYLAEQQLGKTQTVTVDEAPMCLHAWKLTFLHPVKNEPVHFEASPPTWAK